MSFCNNPQKSYPLILRILLFQESNRSKGSAPLFDFTFPEANESVSKNLTLMVLSEMMFGAIPLAQQQTTKIHFLKRGQRILLTKLFTLRLAVNSFQPPNEQKRKCALGAVINLQDEKAHQFPPLVLIDCELGKLVSCLKEIVLELWGKGGVDPESSSSSSAPLQHHPKVEAAIQSFKKVLFGLILSPKLECPIWFQMLRQPKNRSQLALNFVTSFHKLKSFETPRNNFLLSSAITACLLYHKTWIQTIESPSLVIRPHFSNLLQKQLHEIYGDVGKGKVCRVLVVGKHHDIVQHFLTVLSYFIRGSELQLNTVEHDYSIFGKGDTTINNFVPSSEDAEHQPDAELTTRLQMIELDTLAPTEQATSFPFASSLFASYCNSGYCNYFALMGIPHAEDILPRAIADLQSWLTCGLDSWSQKQIPLTEATCLIIDTDKSQCDAITFNPSSDSSLKWKGNIFQNTVKESIPASDLVQTASATLFKLHEIEFPPESLLMHFEGRLGEILEKVQLLAKLEKESPSSGVYSNDTLQALGIKANDLPLLTALLQSTDLI